MILKMVSSLSLLFALAFSSLSAAVTFEILSDDTELVPVLPVDFPDPTIVTDEDGVWWAFATSSGGRSIQVATSGSRDPFNGWERLNEDALPGKTWHTGKNTWAPDVKRLDDGSYIMYFSGEHPTGGRHCIGIARSENIAGPYKADPEPWECPLEEGGAIDGSGFKDEEDEKRFVVYKVDGNSKIGKACGANVDDPNLKTPIMLQEVDYEDGATKIGDPIEILDRIPAQDGALVEAPEMRRMGDGTYVLFFSSHCFFDPLYDIKYGFSDNVWGPYNRAPEPLIKAPMYGVKSPGGPSVGVSADGNAIIAFHGNIDKGRAM